MTKTHHQRIVYVNPNENFWNIPGVDYRGETGTYRLFESMTPSLNQAQLTELYNGEKPKGNSHPMDSVLHFAILSAAHNLKDESLEEAERLRNFLQAGFRQYANTLTRVIYGSLESKSDKVIHNHGTSDEYSLDAKVVGADGWIKDMHDKKVLESFLGTKDINKINEVSNWINKTNFRIWRLNSKPSEKVERVARFSAYSGRLALGCDGGSLAEYPAFRVLRVE